MDNLGTILAVVASLVTIAGGVVAVLQYLERAPWSKHRGRSGIVIASVAVAVLAVLTGSTLAVLQRQKPQPPVANGSPCARLASFAQATAPALGAAFGGVTFPPDALTGGGSFFEVQSYQVEVLHVCVTSLPAGSTTQDIVALRTYYQSDMPAQGWTESSAFPLGGDSTLPCDAAQSDAGDTTGAICWSRDSRFVSVKSVNVVQGSGNVPAAVTYDLWLAVAPVTSSGTITIQRNSTYAFENPAVDTGDIQWLQHGNGTRLVGPVGGAAMAYVGQQDFTGLSVSVLKSMPFGGGALGVGQDGVLTVGDVFGVLTTAGHYVKVQVLGADSSLRITWVLYPYLLD